MFRKPGFQRRSVKVFCSEPGKISKVDIFSVGQSLQIKKPIANPKTGRIMVYSYRDFKLVTTVKDKEGRTFDNTSSLEFRYTFSDDTMAKVGKPPVVTSYPIAEVSSIHMPIKSKFSNPIHFFLQLLSSDTQVMYPNGLKGNLDVQVAVTGYKANVLQSVGVEMPPALASPPAAFGDDEDYDYDDDGELIVSDDHGIAEELSLTLGTDAEIEQIYDNLR